MNEPLELVAGPVRCRLADGELRYLTVGDTEILRRVFFAVRTKTWDTATPKFTRYDVTKNRDSFKVVLEALCERGPNGYDSDAHYRWAAVIEGRRDGTITYTATGEPSADFTSNRIGLCVLFGTPEVSGRAYMVSGASGAVKSQFPLLVNAPLMFEPNFSQLSYATSNGLAVGVALSGSAGTLFSMEDQRNFGDASFKAYAPLPYRYPETKAGERYEETITITVAGAVTASVAPTETTLSARATGPSFPLPEIRQGGSGPKNGYYGVNHERDKTKTQSPLVFAYYPTEHLFDDDTCWENLPCLLDQVVTVRSYAGSPTISLDNIRLEPSHPRPDAEPRHAAPFGAAWAAALLRYAAEAQVFSVVFEFGPGHASRLLSLLASRRGESVRPLTVHHTQLTTPLIAYALGDGFVVINKTAIRQKASLTELSGGWSAREFNGLTAPGSLPPLTPVTVRKGVAHLNLAPNEVRLLLKK